MAQPFGTDPHYLPDQIPDLTTPTRAGGRRVAGREAPIWVIRETRTVNLRTLAPVEPNDLEAGKADA
jgi:hypothetical protein